jgi:ammonium transporter, Amt family
VFNFLVKASLVAIALLLFPLANPALAADPTVVEAMDAAKAAQSSADTAWMLISTALVLLMTPALAFFYGGFVRSKHVLNTLMMTFIMMGIVGVGWALFGYSLSFAPGSAFLGGLGWLGLNNVAATVGDYLPHMILSTQI